MMETKRRIMIVTGTRADYGLLYHLMKRVNESLETELGLLVCGMHLAPEFGRTVDVIYSDGMPIVATVDMLLAGDTPAAMAKGAGVGVLGMAQAMERYQPDVVVVLGDRVEALSAAVAATFCRIPIAHIHGGESTLGAVDEVVRHAVTKMAHFHFAACEAYAKRILQLGEEPWRVHVSGAPGLDWLHTVEYLGVEELSERLGMDFSKPVAICTYHPETAIGHQPEWMVDQFIAAVEEAAVQAVITYPNADAGGRAIIKKLGDFVARRFDRVRLVRSLGQTAYLSVLRHAAVMVGNSSSGIIEAASFHLPVVNVGERQKGRVRAANVIDVGYSSKEILSGIHTALFDERFRDSLHSIVNPYGDGRASDRIYSVLCSAELGPEALIKNLTY